MQGNSLSTTCKQKEAMDYRCIFNAIRISLFEIFCNQIFQDVSLLLCSRSCAFFVERQLSGCSSWWCLTLCRWQLRSGGPVLFGTTRPSQEHWGQGQSSAGAAEGHLWKAGLNDSQGCAPGPGTGTGKGPSPVASAGVASPPSASLSELPQSR